MSLPAAAVAGIAAAGAVALLACIVLLYCYVSRLVARRNRSSDTGSSDPSNLVEWNRHGGRASSAGGGSLMPPEHQGARQFTLEELSKATKNFSDINLVGAGSFGLVYKGLLLDGTVVAVKRRVVAAPRLDFVDEVKKLAEVWHRNIVTLIGYCQDGGLQMLVFEYVPNGSVCSHLYDTGKEHAARLEFKQRLAIAIGVAKGLSHLHGLAPPLIHGDFKTSNVLVDENFIAKVADVGVSRLLRGADGDGAGPSQAPGTSVYRDPEAQSPGQLSDSADVYSFGVFLLELVAGQDAARFVPPDSKERLAHWVDAHHASNELVDSRLVGTFTSSGMTELVRLTLHCLHPSPRRRPRMRALVNELDHILEMEMSMTTVMGDGTAIITLGSQLFTSAS